MSALLFGFCLLLAFLYWLLTPVARICPLCREPVAARASVCLHCHRTIKPAQHWLSWITKNSARVVIIVLLAAYVMAPQNRAILHRHLQNLIGDRFEKSNGPAASPVSQGTGP